MKGSEVFVVNLKIYVFFIVLFLDNFVMFSLTFEPVRFNTDNKTHSNQLDYHNSDPFSH